MKAKIICILGMGLLIATALPCISGNVGKNENLNATINYEFKLGEFIVKFAKDSAISSQTINNLNEKYKVSSMNKLFKNPENTILDNIYLLSVPEDSDILSIVKDYGNLPDVVYAEPNVIGEFYLTPNDEFFEYQWVLHNTGQNLFPPGYPPMNGTFDCDIDAPEAWDIGVGNPDVVIAILDSGVDYTHPDLADNIWVNEDEIPDNEVDDDGNGYIDDVRGWDFYYDDNDPLDGHGHGTRCAGLPGMVTDNSIGGAGVCWNCKIMIVQIANESWLSYSSDWAVGIQYAADNGADIISMSFGTLSKPDPLRDAVNYAYGKGVFLCAAAGNHNSSFKRYPAGFDNVTAVGATNEHDERCDEDDWGPGSGSNYGDWVDIAAPGNICGTTSPTYPFYQYPYHPMNYTSGGGTSASSPIVAGVAALLLSRDPSLSPDEVKTRICKYVDPYNSTEYIGTGRVNAHKAMKNIKATSNTEISLSTLEEIKQLNRVVYTPFLNFLENHPNMFYITSMVVSKVNLNTIKKQSFFFSLSNSNIEISVK